MSYVYDKSGQSLFFVREATYGEPYDPEAALSAWTILAADYPHWRRFDKIPEGLDLIVPLIEKLKQFDLGDSKHASAILSGNIEPVEFTIPMTAQGLEFLALACGKPSLTSHDRKISQILTFTTVQPTQGDYFLFDIINGSDVVEHYALWSDTTNDDSTGKPAITGINASRVLSVDTSGPPANITALADAVQAELEGITGVTTAANIAGVITVVVDNAGAVQAAHDSGSAPFDMTSSVTTYGSTQYTMSEELTTILPSFTLHAEQRNTTTAEDIVWDMFGCVVESIEVRVGFDDKVTKYNVTFKCPYALENTNGRATNPPPRKNLLGFPTMSSMQESANNYLLQEENATTAVHTDRTPQTVDLITLNITNNVTFKADIAKRYKASAYSGKRDITMQVVGATHEKELFTYWQGAYTARGDDWKPTSASGRLNTKFKLQKDATYDYILMSIRGWLLKDHNFHFVDVEEAVKSVDMILEDGAGDSNGRVIDSFTMISYIDETVMIV